MTRISALGVSTIKATRRVFEYGLLLMIPFLPLLGFAPDAAAFLNPINIGNLLFFGFGCFSSLFCHVEFFSQAVGISSDERVYLSGARNYGSCFVDCFGRTFGAFGLVWCGSYNRWFIYLSVFVCKP